MIRSYTASNWLQKLSYQYKNIYKDVFIDRYKQPDIVGDCKIFLEKIEKLKLYTVEFDNNSIIKAKVYSLYCKVRGYNR